MSNPYMGTWRIMDMEEWGQEDIDLVVPGYITFTEDRLGAFQFGTVEGSLDYHIEPYVNGERLVAFAGFVAAGRCEPVSGHRQAQHRFAHPCPGRLFDQPVIPTPPRRGSPAAWTLPRPSRVTACTPP